MEEPLSSGGTASGHASVRPPDPEYDGTVTVNMVEVKEKCNEKMGSVSVLCRTPSRRRRSMFARPKVCLPVLANILSAPFTARWLPADVHASMFANSAHDIDGSAMGPNRCQRTRSRRFRPAVRTLADRAVLLPNRARRHRLPQGTHAFGANESGTTDHFADRSRKHGTRRAGVIGWHRKYVCQLGVCLPVLANILWATDGTRSLPAAAKIVCLPTRHTTSTVGIDARWAQSNGP
jgi:hypothetical protein